MAYIVSPPVTTRADFAKNVLQQIGVVPSGAIPSSEDQADVLQVYNQEWGDLNRQGIATWPMDVFPAEVVARLIDYIGVCASPQFGITVTTEDRSDALQALIVVAGRPYTGAPAWNQYY